MQLWMENPDWQVYVMPRRDELDEAMWSWGLYGRRFEDPYLEQATFGVAYRHKRSRYLHRPYLQRLQALRKEGRATWQADDQGLQVALEFRLHATFPLVQWRLHLAHQGRLPLEVEEITLLEVGPLRPVTSSRHRWGLGWLPFGFLRMRKKPRSLAQVGALRLHPSPARLVVLGPPWPWEEAPPLYSEDAPYLPSPRARTPQGSKPPRPTARDHAFLPGLALLWDAQHGRGVAVALAAEARQQPTVEVRLQRLHPALRLAYRPLVSTWSPGHRETTPWAFLALFSREKPEALHALARALPQEAVDFRTTLAQAEGRLFRVAGQYPPHP